jgi:hypothetical protein
MCDPYVINSEIRCQVHYYGIFGEVFLKMLISSQRYFPCGEIYNKPMLGIKRVTHKMIAVSLGIEPVYSMANRLGRSFTASR